MSEVVPALIFVKTGTSAQTCAIPSMKVRSGINIVASSWLERRSMIICAHGVRGEEHAKYKREGTCDYESWVEARSIWFCSMGM